MGIPQAICTAPPRLFHTKYLVQPETEAYYHSLFNNSVRLWSFLPNSLVTSPSVLSFKTDIKQKQDKQTTKSTHPVTNPTTRHKLETNAGSFLSCLFASLYFCFHFKCFSNVQLVVSNRWTGLWTGSLDWIAGLDCWTGLLDWITGLDCWTGLLDWITGLDCWTGLLDWIAGLDCWTGLLDWIAGLDCWTGLLDWIAGLDCWTGLLDWILKKDVRLACKTACEVKTYASQGHTDVAEPQK